MKEQTYFRSFIFPEVGLHPQPTSTGHPGTRMCCCGCGGGDRRTDGWMDGSGMAEPERSGEEEEGGGKETFFGRCIKTKETID